MTDVVVTGVGLVTPLGTGKEAFWKGLLEGRSGAGTISRFDPSELAVKIACEVKDFDPSETMAAREISRSDRFTQFGVSAAVQAWEDAGLEASPVPEERAGVIIGSSMGGVETIEREYEVLRTSGSRRVNPLAIIKYMANEAAALVSMRYSMRGLTYTLSSACATGTHSVGEAFRAIQAGRIDIAIAGATDAAITPLWISAFSRMGAISTRNDDPERASRPFDAERDGFVFGEGAGALVLERRDLAEERGARILARLVGYGASSDAHHLVEPHPDGIGAEAAMRDCMSEAGVTPEDVDYINAHGTGTTLNDKLETMVIKNVMGMESKGIPISSTKSQIGHLLGAAGVVEAATCVMAIERGVLPGTINLQNPDPECDLDYMPDGPREADVGLALSNSFGLGGHNGCLAFRSP